MQFRRPLGPFTRRPVYPDGGRARAAPGSTLGGRGAGTTPAMGPLSVSLWATGASLTGVIVMLMVAGMLSLAPPLAWNVKLSGPL